MKHLKLLTILILPLLLTGCWGYNNSDDDLVFVEPVNYTPVTMTRQAMEASVELMAPTSVVKSGKIYIKDNLLFVNDVNRGFHIYKYNDPSNPVEIAFLQAAGATDLAMRGTTLYINQATDLLTLVYDNNTIYFIKRNMNVFPQKTAPDGSLGYAADNEIITDWVAQ